MAAAGEDERAELEVEVAGILCDLKKILRARDRRRRRRMQRQQREKEAQVVPSWGRRRLRSVLEDGKPSAAPARVAERDGAASPDTPLAFPDSVPEEEDNAEKKARAQKEWAQQQRVVVASLSQEKVDLLKQIEEYRARLLTSRTANESLKQLHRVRQQEEQARKMRMLAALRPGMAPHPHRPAAALGLDLNEPARLPPDDEAEAARARAVLAQAQAQAQRERYWQAQQLHRAASTAEARRRRLEILRAKVASPLVSCRTRRVAG